MLMKWANSLKGTSKHNSAQNEADHLNNPVTMKEMKF